MDFLFSEEQNMLRDAVRDVLSAEASPEARNEITDTELGWNEQVWKQLAEMGILGMTFDDPGEDSEDAAGPVETMVVMHEIGRSLATVPVLDCVLVPGWLVYTGATEEQVADLLPSIADGSRLTAFAHREPGSRLPVGEVGTKAERDGDGWVVTGLKNPVDHGDCAADLIVSATDPDGTTGLFLVAADADGVDRRGYRTHDRLRAAQVEFDRAPATRLGADDEDLTPVIAEVAVRTRAALAAEAVGAMEKALEITAEYLKSRKQFGVPLSMFQALTFRASDMYVSVELARSMAMYATMALASGQVDQADAARVAAVVGSRSRHVAKEAIQLHGGIGMTLEHLVGHLAARLFQIDAAAGTADDHLGELARGVDDYEMLTIG